ncbi:hypothetical protein ACSBR1_032324 [Camellia fascicularis]
MSKASESATRQPEADTDSRIGTRSRTYWQPPMDRYFIDLMLEQVQKGNQIDGLFHKQAWTEMIAHLMLDLDLTDDRVWQDYIKAHADARQYMTRPVPYYKDLCGICRELSSDGRDSVSDHNLDQQDNIPEVQEPSHEGFKNKRHLENTSYSAHSKKGWGNNEGMSSALREMATAVSCLADKKKDDEDSSSISVENVMEAIQALPDMDENFILDACDLLEDEKKAKTFWAYWMLN